MQDNRTFRGQIDLMTQTQENGSIPIEIDVHDVKQLFDAQVEFLLVDCRESDLKYVVVSPQCPRSRFDILSF